MANAAADFCNFQTESSSSNSISFGRFESESLSWERKSSFSHNRYLEEVVKCSSPGSVIEKKAYFEAHFKKTALRNLIALENQAQACEVKEASVNDVSPNDIMPKITDIGNEPTVGMDSHMVETETSGKALDIKASRKVQKKTTLEKRPSSSKIEVSHKNVNKVRTESKSSSINGKDLHQRLQSGSVKKVSTSRDKQLMTSMTPKGNGGIEPMKGQGKTDSKQPPNPPNKSKLTPKLLQTQGRKMIGEPCSRKLTPQHQKTLPTDPRREINYVGRAQKPPPGPIISRDKAKPAAVKTTGGNLSSKTRANTSVRESVISRGMSTRIFA